MDGRARRPLDIRTSRLLSLSGKTDQALRDLAGRYLTWLDQKAEALATSDGAADQLLADVAWTASVGRSHFPVRAGLTFRDDESLRDGLRALAAATEEPSEAPPQSVAFVYTGQGSQWVGMGEDLYRSEPVGTGRAGPLRRGLQERAGHVAARRDVWGARAPRATFTTRPGRSLRCTRWSAR